MKNITEIYFEESDYGKFLSVQMQQGKAVISISENTQMGGCYHCEIPSESNLSIPIQEIEPESDSNEEN